MLQFKKNNIHFVQNINCFEQNIRFLILLHITILVILSIYSYYDILIAKFFANYQDSFIAIYLVKLNQHIATFAISIGSILIIFFNFWTIKIIIHVIKLYKLNTNAKYKKYFLKYIYINIISMFHGSLLYTSYNKTTVMTIIYNLTKLNINRYKSVIYLLCVISTMLIILYCFIKPIFNRPRPYSVIEIVGQTGCNQFTPAFSLSTNCKSCDQNFNTIKNFTKNFMKKDFIEDLETIKNLNTLKNMNITNNITNNIIKKNNIRDCKSFGSGHAAAVYILCTISFLPFSYIKKNRIIILYCGIFIASMTGITRIISKDHFASDVVLSGLLVLVVSSLLSKILYYNLK